MGAQARPNATTVSLNRDVVEKCKEVAEELGVTTKELMDSLLKHALAQEQISVEVKTVTVKPAALAKNKGRK